MKNKEEDEKRREGEWRQDEEPDDRERNGSDSGCSEDGESTDAVDRVRMPAAAVRREYGAVRTDLSTASAAYVKHEITFKIGLRIAAEIHRHSTDTVRIQYGSLADRDG